MSNVRTINANIYLKLINDEELMRLLHYPPSPPNPSPLSDQYEDIIGSENYWDIVDKHVLLSSKADDLEDNSLCRIYIYSGKPKRIFGNNTAVRREIVIDVLCHQSYERDQRLEWIIDRINKNLVRRNIEGGLGKMEAYNGYDFKAPKGYIAYRLIYLIGDSA